MTSARKIDANGFLLVKACPISSFGLFDYSAAQLGLPGDPNRIVKVYRPESAVSDPEAIASFQNVPFIIDHEMLSGFEDDKTASAPEDYGIDGVLTSVSFDSPWMRGDIKVFSRQAQKALAQKKRDLSLGYSCDFKMTPGTFKGQPYEVVQTNMRGNHVALVDEGRVPGARILDGICFDSVKFNVEKYEVVTGLSIKKEKIMPKKVKDAAEEAAQQAQLATVLKQAIVVLRGLLAEQKGEAADLDPDNNGNTIPAHVQAAAKAAADKGLRDGRIVGNAQLYSDAAMLKDMGGVLDSVSMTGEMKEFLAQADAEFDRTMLQARIQDARGKGVYSDIPEVKKAQLAFDEKVAIEDKRDAEQFGMKPRMRKNWDPLLKRFKE